MYYTHAGGMYGNFMDVVENVDQATCVSACQNQANCTAATYVSADIECYLYAEFNGDTYGEPGLKFFLKQCPGENIYQGQFRLS